MRKIVRIIIFLLLVPFFGSKTGFSFLLVNHHGKIRGNNVSRRILLQKKKTYDAPSSRMTTPTSIIIIPTSANPLLLPLATAASDNDSNEEDDIGDGGGVATIPQEVFNLVKGIVGVGVLSLPAGIAAFANSQSAIVPSIALVTIIGIISGYGFFLIGRVCSLTQTKTFREAWSKSVSPKTSWIPALSVILLTLGFVVSYSMVLGDTFASLLDGIGIVGLSTTSILLGLTTTVLLPLCLLKNLSSLAPFSLVGVLGMLYTALAMAIRYFGTAYKPGGRFYNNDIPYLPIFGSIGAKGIWNPSTSILIGMLSTAYVAHFNAPKFYVELKNNTLPRYAQVVSISFAISIALFASMASLGFCTFGGACSGVILNNYSSRDTIMSLSRIAVATSLVCSYPLAFVGVRDGFLDLFQLTTKFQESNTKTNLLTVALLSIVTTLALVIPDVTFILSFMGATLGNALIYVYPAIMFRGAVKKRGETTNNNNLLKREVQVAMSNAAVGIGMGILGAKMAIQSLR